MTDKKVEYEVSANNAGFVNAMRGLAQSASSADSQVRASFSGIGSAVTAVHGRLLALAAVVGGGSVFSKLIEGSNKLTGEVAGLARTMNLSVGEASALNTALGDIGADAGTYTDAFQKFAGQLRNNEVGLQSMGLKTRDANGHLRDTNTMYREAVGLVGQYAPGLDRTTAAMNLFGKSVDDVMKLQRLTNEVLEEAKRKNEELGLTITQENVAATKAYKAAMNDVGDVLTAVGKVLGDAVMPIFTEAAQDLAAMGPKIVDAVRIAAVSVVAVLRTMALGFQSLGIVAREVYKAIVDGAGLIGEVFARLFRGDFSGAWDASKALGQRLGEGFKTGFDDIVAATATTNAKLAADLERIGSKGTPVEEPKPTGGGKHMGTLKAGEAPKSRMQAWETELAAAKVAFQEQANAQGSFQQYSKAQEERYWQDKLRLTEKGSSDNLSIRKRIADLELEQNKQRFAAVLESLRAEAEQYKANHDARVEVLTREAALVKQRFGEESREFEEVQKRILQAQRDGEAQRERIIQIGRDRRREAQLAEVEIERTQLDLARDLRQVDQQAYFQELQRFESRRFELQMAGLEERMQVAEEAADRDLEAIARLMAEREQLEREHQGRLAQIQADAVREAAGPYQQTQSAIVSGWARAMSQLASGTMTVRDFAKQMFIATGQAIINTLSQIAAQRLMDAAVSAILGKKTTAGEITRAAGAAGANAVASAAAIPLYGWSIAPAAGASAFTAAMSFMPAASAMDGYDVPAGVSPITQLHPREMVLPERQADVIREAADHGGFGGPISITVQAHDATGFERLLTTHADHLVDAVVRALRDGKRPR